MTRAQELVQLATSDAIERTPTSLYRLFDAEGQLIYVGIGGNPGRRFEQHRNNKPWWGKVATIRLEHFDHRAHAEAAEALAIINERPPMNDIGASAGEDERCWDTRKAEAVDFEPVRVQPGEISAGRRSGAR